NGRRRRSTCPSARCALGRACAERFCRQMSLCMWNSSMRNPLSRRELLRASSTGFGALALAALLANETSATPPAADALAPKPPQFRARAKRVISLFMHGGPSQVDTFDYKPLLARDHGKPLPFAKPRVVSSETGNLLQSPFKFRQYSQCGAWASEIFPHIGSV